MKNKFFIRVTPLFLFSLLLLLFTYCSKDALSSKSSDLSKNSNSTITSRSENTILEPFHSIVGDTNSHQILLGNPKPNPYLKSNMRQAFINIYGFDPCSELPTTDIYIKWMPQTDQQLTLLNRSGIEFKNYDLSREVIQNGDFYQVPGKNPTDLQEYYSVVKSSDLLPNVPHVILQEMFIPKNSPVLENEAIRLVGMLENVNDFLTIRNTEISRIRENPCLDMPTELPCDTCEVDDSNLRGGGNIIGRVEVEVRPRGNFIPVKNVKVKIESTAFWGKKDKVFTDELGNFRSEKTFSSKTVTFEVVFENGNHKVVRERDNWQSTWNFGSALSVQWPSWRQSNSQFGTSITLRIPFFNAPETDEVSEYCGAHIHNGIEDYRKFVPSEVSSKSLPNWLEVLVKRSKGVHHGRCQMRSHFTGLPYNRDIYLGYGQPPKLANGSPDMSFFDTDRYSEVIYHELSHALHAMQVGAWYWGQLGFSEKFNCGSGTYGGKGNWNSGIIAVSEAWAYHFGHYTTDKLWKATSTSFPEQGDIDNLKDVITFNNSSIGTSHLTFLENFDPNRSLDPNAWIPKGIMNDLIDTRGEQIPIKDDVNRGFFTNQMIFNALQSDVNFVQEYRDKLMEPLPQPLKNEFWIPVRDLFAQYGY